ncbi:MAG: hypothetical protein MJ172_09655 [Clostridia bacterium]|nr:hypothetical protein [Clostridia bacterium]
MKKKKLPYFLSFILITSCIACSRDFPEPTTMQESTTIVVAYDDENLETLPVNTDDLIADALDRHHYSDSFSCGTIELVFDSNVRVPSVNEASGVTIQFDKERLENTFGVILDSGVTVLSEETSIMLDGFEVGKGHYTASQGGTSIGFIDYDNFTKDVNSPDDSHWNDYEYITSLIPNNCNLSAEDACNIAMAFTAQDLVFDYEPANVKIFNNNDPEGLGFYDLMLRATYDGLPLTRDFGFYSTVDVSDKGIINGSGRFYYKIIEEGEKETILTLDEIVNIFIEEAEGLASGGNSITVHDISLCYVPVMINSLEMFKLVPVWEFDYCESFEDLDGSFNIEDKVYFSAIDGSKLIDLGYPIDE